MARAAGAAAAPARMPISLSSPSSLRSTSTPSSQRLRRRQTPAGRRRRREALSIAWDSSQPSKEKTRLEPFPSSLDEAVRMARKATRAAFEFGTVSVAEVEMPSSALYAVMGDTEGANEMTYSAELLRDFVREWEPQLGSKIRVFFPDKAELAVATKGRGMDPAAGSAGVKPSFAQTSCSLE